MICLYQQRDMSQFCSSLHKNGAQHIASEYAKKLLKCILSDNINENDAKMNAKFWKHEREAIDPHVIGSHSHKCQLCGVILENQSITVCDWHKSSQDGDAFYGLDMDPRIVNSLMMSEWTYTHSNTISTTTATNPT